MIIARAPLRVTLGGGGTDLPSYSSAHEGFCVSAAIDKYVYISLHRTFERRVLVKYSKMEEARDISAIRHPIVREALAMFEVEPFVEICSMADIPAGTGLGSSSAFTVALLHALHAHKKSPPVAPETIAEEACAIEIDRLDEPIGKQDQYIASHGGVACLRFGRDGRVGVQNLACPPGVLTDLEERLLLFFTGFSRSASSVLAEQKGGTLANDPQMIENLHRVKEMGLKSRELLESGQVDAWGRLMHDHWELKKRRSAGVSNPQVDRWYSMALQSGAIGGKLVGAGGGGFLMLLAAEKERLRSAMQAEGLREVNFAFDTEGARVLVDDAGGRVGCD